MNPQRAGTGAFCAWPSTINLSVSQIPSFGLARLNDTVWGRKMVNKLEGKKKEGGRKDK